MAYLIRGDTIRDGRVIEHLPSLVAPLQSFAARQLSRFRLTNF